MIEEIRAEATAFNAGGIAKAVARLAARGEIARGERLPTVRQLARALGVSSATVGEAWRSLAAQGIVSTEGRRGTFLRGVDGHEPVRQFRHVFGTDVRVDMSTGYPDPALLPDLRPFLRQLADAEPFNGYPDVVMEPALRALIEESLPFRSQALLLGSDSLTMVSELLPMLARYGQGVVVGSPEFAPYLDLFQRYGLDCIPVEQDDDGLHIGALERALEARPALVVLQPRVHNPTGIPMSRERLEQIASRCRATETYILEVDHFGRLASSPLISAGRTAPEITVHLRSFSKDLHPDVRVCAVAGPNAVLERVHQRRIGGNWVSALNQRLLAALISSAAIADKVRQNKRVYDERRQRFLAALAAESVETRSRDGFNLWVPVRSESAALIYLASRGISAAPGAPFHTSPNATPHLRLSIAQLESDHAEIAHTVAQAAQARRRGAFEPSL